MQEPVRSVPNSSVRRLLKWHGEKTALMNNGICVFSLDIVQWGYLLSGVLYQFNTNPRVFQPRYAEVILHIHNYIVAIGGC